MVLTDKMNPSCHKCQHVELQPTGPLYCTATMYVVPTRLARMPEGECGPDGTLYEERNEIDTKLAEDR